MNPENTKPTCVECGGKGTVTLFTSIKPCSVCKGGQGWSDVWTSERTFVVTGFSYDGDLTEQYIDAVNSGQI